MRDRVRLRVSLVCLFLMAAGHGSLEQIPLTLREAVSLAAQQNPDRKVALADVEMARVGSKVARNGLLPNLYFSESAFRGNDPVYVFGSRLRQHGFQQSDFALNSLNRPTPLNDFVTRFSGNWTAFDSWHTQYEIRRADLMAQSTSDSAERSKQEVVYRTVEAYEAILLAVRRLEVARQDAETARAIQVSSKNRVDAGLTVDADQLTASAYLAERQQAQIAAEGDVQIAWAELEAAIGQPIAAEQRNLQPLEEKKFEVPSLSAAVEVAEKSRLDRSSLEKQRNAQRIALQSARAGYGPQINVVGSWETDKGSFAGSGGNSWTAGAELRLDILPLAKRQNVSSAKIGLSRMDATAAAVDQQIRLEVTRAYFQHQSAQQMLAVARASTAQTEESLRTLKDRYEAGLATMTDLLRSEDADRQSRANYWQAAYRNTLTYANLRFADGTLTQDTAGDLQ
jgi:outer membrane protein